jgi:hypothetical protein
MGKPNASRAFAGLEEGTAVIYQHSKKEVCVSEKILQSHSGWESRVSRWSLIVQRLHAACYVQVGSIPSRDALHNEESIKESDNKNAPFFLRSTAHAAFVFVILIKERPVQVGPRHVSPKPK